MLFLTEESYSSVCLACSGLGCCDSDYIQNSIILSCLILSSVICIIGSLLDKKFKILSNNHQAISFIFSTYYITLSFGVYDIVKGTSTGLSVSEVFIYSQTKLLFYVVPIIFITSLIVIINKLYKKKF